MNEKNMKYEHLTDYDLENAVHDAEINLQLAKDGQPPLGMEWERNTINALLELYGTYVMRSAVTIQHLQNEIAGLKEQLKKVADENPVYQEMEKELTRIRQKGTLVQAEVLMKDLVVKCLKEKLRDYEGSPIKLFKD